MKELEVIQKCITLIKNIGDKEAMKRILFYLNQEFTSEQNNLEVLESKETLKTSKRIEEYPQIKDLVILDYPKSESEWVLIFCFYASKYGTDTFIRDNIIELYEVSARKTKQRIKNLSLSMSSNIKKGFIKRVNDNDYVVTSEGKETVKNILLTQ